MGGDAMEGVQDHRSKLQQRRDIFQTGLRFRNRVNQLRRGGLESERASFRAES